MVGWKRWAARRRAARSAGAAPSDLRVHLPLLWPHGPDRPVDLDALQALAQEYARTGRSVEDLLADLDQLCTVLGIGTSSRMIETSSVAWADAFLDTVGSAGPDPAASLVEVERRATHPLGEEWRDLLPGSRLVVVSWPEGATPDRAELRRVMAEVRSLFPGAAVAEQVASGEVVAAVDGDDDLDRRTALLCARCAELVRTGSPAVQVLACPVDADAARRLFRRAG